MTSNWPQGEMGTQTQKACTTAERRKKLAVFASLCVLAVVIIVLIVFAFATFSSKEKEVNRGIVRVFTNLGRVGPEGPEDEFEYLDTVLEKEVKIVKGIQLWTVPISGVWYIEVYGASGGDGLYGGHYGRLNGGLGAKLTGKLKLNEGDVLMILIGQQGRRDHLTPFRAGSGGGGTFIVSSDGQALMVAGGGGGGGVPKLGKYSVGGPGRTELANRTADGGHLFDPQKNITIYTHVQQGNHNCMAGAGGGFNKDGGEYLEGWGGKSYQHGGEGGTIKRATFNVMTGTKRSGYEGGGADGGFGGGGASGLLPGGGGGYIGGSVRGAYLYDVTYKMAEGGTSYNHALYPTITPGVNKKNGKVFIKYLRKEHLPYHADRNSDPRVPKTYEDWYKE